MEQRINEMRDLSSYNEFLFVLLQADYTIRMSLFNNILHTKSIPNHVI